MSLQAQQAEAVEKRKGERQRSFDPPSEERGKGKGRKERSKKGGSQDADDNVDVAELKKKVAKAMKVS